MLWGTTLAAGVQRGADNFLPLRHLAAGLVVYGHCYALARPEPDRADLVARLLPGFYAGSLAVYLFFAISGYLVTLSLLRNPGVLRYAWRRALRIFPGYYACLLFCVFVLGLAVTTLDVPGYLAHPETWGYLRQNLLPISLAWHLPGVFADNPQPSVVNGTLWSLGLELRWYFYLGLLAALGVVRRRSVFTAVAAALLAYGAWEWWSGKPDVNDYRALSQTFLLGALCAQWRERIRVSHLSFAGLVALVALSSGTRYFTPLVVLAAVHFVYWAAYALPPMRWPRHVDYSYGIFLYGFPLQQWLLSMAPDLSPLALLAPSLALACALAALSWHLVERPALRWRWPWLPRPVATG